jgi:hypothetical protein
MFFQQVIYPSRNVLTIASDIFSWRGVLAAISPSRLTDFRCAGPWIHNCVGHNNHRYFVLFMTYMVLSAFYFVAVAWQPFIITLDFINTEVEY